jgi:predicted O-linked N-acetylglucosamine transferase (SPINDLY family)
LISPSDSPEGRAARASELALLGQRQLQAGRVAQAIASFREATVLDPAAAVHWLGLGRAQAAHGRLTVAETSLRRAGALEPGNADLAVALADLLLQQNKAAQALDACRRAVAAQPDNIHAAVTEALLLPPIYASAEDLGHWRSRFASGLSSLRARESRWQHKPQGVLAVEATNFYLAYQGGDDLDLQSGYSDFLASLLARAMPDLQALAPRAQSPRIRVGLLSSNLKVSTISDYFGSWITDLPRDRFEVVAILCAGIPDSRTEALARASDRFLAANGASADIARAVKSLSLDILVFLDVGMTPWGSLLANLRLARVQCAAWGHPVTTGSGFVDYFLSCGDMEPPDADSHYREHLIRLPGLGTRYMPPPAVEPARREHFGLPEGRRLYLCPQSLFKIHPDADALFLDVLERDPEAVLLFVAATTEGQRHAFVRRLEEGMRQRGLAPRQQIKLLPLLSHRDFRRLMTVVDVMIDTPHWSGGRTSLDALGSGLPIVTLQGRFMRGRQSAAMLRALGLDELIAPDARAYVERALSIAADAAYRERLSLRIREGWGGLVDRSEPIAALAAALERMAGQSR